MKKINIKKNKNGGLSLRRSEATGKGETSVFIQNHTAGFTLIEALVAVSILMIAIAGPMTLAQKSLMSATLSKDQMIAGLLAQDGIESVKNIRDQIARNQASGLDWLGTLASAVTLKPCVCSDLTVDGNHPEVCNFDSKITFSCYIDTTSSMWNGESIGFSPRIGSLKSLPKADAYKLQINFDSFTKGFLKYDYVGSQLSRFSRYINIEQLTDYEAKINVRVFWDSPTGIQKVDVQDFIYNYSGNQ